MTKHGEGTSRDREDGSGGTVLKVPAFDSIAGKQRQEDPWGLLAGP